MLGITMLLQNLHREQSHRLDVGVCVSVLVRIKAFKWGLPSNMLLRQMGRVLKICL